MTLYGPDIPGEWYVLGIFSNRFNTKNNTSKNPFRQSIHELSRCFNEMVKESETPYTLNPIIIYRDILL